MSALLRRIRSPLSLKAKLIIRFTVLFIVLFLAVEGTMLISFRSISLDSSKTRAMSSASMILDSLTTFMVMGGMPQRDIFFAKIMDGRYGITRIKVLRGDAVSQQFGPPREDEKPETDLEFLVLREGALQERIEEDSQKVLYNLVVPYKAIPSKHANCLACHKTKEGTLLGAVSITFDLTDQRDYGIKTLIQTSLISLVFVGLMLYGIAKFFMPYNRLFGKLAEGFRQIATGIFREQSTQEEYRMKEEEILEDYNSMVRRLSGTLEEINSNASILVGRKFKNTGNVLADTKATVDNLLEIYNFKRIIEKDLTKGSIYRRLEDVISRAGVRKYSIYEVDHQKESMKVINAVSNREWAQPAQVDGAESSEGMIWCNGEMLEHPMECRAMRTGVMADSSLFPQLCPNFAYGTRQQAGEIGYYCFPVYVAGKVGNVFQIVYESSEAQAVKEAIPILQSYFLEAAPVLEGKTFMELMRQQTLVDQLTGLYNRRFLDELSSKIQSSMQRRKGLVGILMIDVDYFKMVNDQYGHNVGDTVLQRVSAVILASIRSSDLAVRYGGEEILVLLMDVEPDRSQEVAEKIRRNVESEAIEIPGGALKKTVSVGVCEFPAQSKKFWQCVKYADLALYQAKENGRNQVLQFTDDLWPKEAY